MPTLRWQSLYEHAPPWLKDAALSTYGLLLERQRYGGEFPALFDGAMDATFASPDTLRAIQQREWDRRIRPALAAIRAYGSRALEFDALDRLPVLTKPEVRARLDDFLHPARARMGLVAAHTSGTTGAGLRFYTTRFATQRQWAYWWRYRRWHGIPFGEWCATFGGRTVVPADRSAAPFWQVNRTGHAVLFSQYHLTPERVPLYLAEIRRRGVRWLHGYPSLLALVAQAGIDAGLAGTVPVTWITLGAENVLPAQRRAIEAMFGVAPRQHYGMAEGVAGISECPDGRLHVDEDYARVEFVPQDDDPSACRIVGTTLDNAAMPLLRYDTGDVARLPDDPAERCPCGRPGRLVRAIDGRREDYLVLSDGVPVGRINHLFKDAVRVAEAQVVQHRRGEATFRVVRAKGYAGADEDALRAEAHERFGDRLRVDFEYVDRLPRTERGKLRLVVSTLREGALDPVPDPLPSP